MGTKTKSETPSGVTHEASSTSSLSAWQARAVHTITCPSGQRLKIRIPGIGTLLEHGDLPEDLIEIALLELSAENGATGELAAELARANGDNRGQVLERIRRYGTFQRELVRAAVTAVETSAGEWQEVSLSADDVASGALPEDDLALVAEIVQRLRGHDAKGVRIGVEPLDRWATFREAHGCGEPGDASCEGCQKLVAALSSVDVGAV